MGWISTNNLWPDLWTGMCSKRPTNWGLLYNYGSLCPHRSHTPYVPPRRPPLLPSITGFDVLRRGEYPTILALLHRLIWFPGHSSISLYICYTIFGKLNFLLFSFQSWKATRNHSPLLVSWVMILMDQIERGALWVWPLGSRKWCVFDNVPQSILILNLYQAGLRKEHRSI